MALGGTCSVHGSHRPAYTGTEVHHILPLGMGGKDEPANRVDICPTGHTNIHSRLSWLLWKAGYLTRATVMREPKVSTRENQLAQQGMLAWIAAGQPGNVHASYGHVHPVIAPPETVG